MEIAVSDPSSPVDQKDGSPVVSRLFVVAPVSPGNGMQMITQEPERKVVVLRPFMVGVDVVAADPEDCRVQVRKAGKSSRTAQASLVQPGLQSAG